MRFHSHVRAALISVLMVTMGAIQVGCQTREPVTPDAKLTSAEPPRAPDLGRGSPRLAVDSPTRVYVAEPVRKVCKGSLPFFDFDSSSTRSEDQTTLRELADCMMSGPLAGKTIKLIGRTDPRGTAAYNAKLGMERAERVKAALVERGVDANRVLLESGGMDQASPFPDDWPTDRRVEVELQR